MSNLRSRLPEEFLARDQWFLSVDCATKSFASALVRVRVPPADIWARVEAAFRAALRGEAGGAEKVREIDLETKSYYHLAGGSAVDLVPGKKDKEISTVERVRAVKKHLDTKVAALLEAARADGCPPADSPELNVAIEFQMGPNAKSRVVEIILLTQYAYANIFLVGPSLKNNLAFRSRPDLYHCMFIEKYASGWTANKAHAKAVYFDHLAKIFGHEIPEDDVPAKLRSDFSDAAIQILGFLSFGDVSNAAKKF